MPRQAVGLVIGKGGEMIKKIQSETGAKVQFKPGKKIICKLMQPIPFAVAVSCDSNEVIFGKGRPFGLPVSFVLSAF